jgi:hypothetical protein
VQADLLHDLVHALAGLRPQDGQGQLGQQLEGAGAGVLVGERGQ